MVGCFDRKLFLTLKRGWNYGLQLPCLKRKDSKSKKYLKLVITFTKKEKYGFGGVRYGIVI